MPNSLFDMFQPQNVAGEQVGFGQGLQNNSNSLIGLGMGLLQPYRPGESPYAQALQGWQAGSALDQRRGVAQAQLQHQKRQEARQAAQQGAQNARQAREDAYRREQDTYKRDLDARDYDLRQQQLNKPQVLGSPESGYFIYDPSRAGSPKVAAPGAGAPAAAQEPFGAPQDGPIRQITPGQGKALPEGTAGKLAMLEAAKPGLDEAKKYFLDPKPLHLREGGDEAGGALYSMGKQYLGEKTNSFEIGRQRRNVRYGIEAALRAATGAAAPEQEVERYTDMYAPSITDSYATRKQKIEALERFMSTYEEIATRGRGASKPASSPPAPSTGGVRRYNPATGKIE